MWDELLGRFSRYPAQARVVRLMMTYGLRVEGGHVFCGDIRLKSLSIAKAAGVDRRVVTATVQTISEDSRLADVFSRLRPACHFGDVAPVMGWGAIEIVPTNASKPGILAGIADIIAEAGISVRQALVDDDMISDTPRAYIITESKVPERLLPRIMALEGVESVVLH